MQDKRIVLPGKVLDNVDPLMLGRVRIEPQTKLENQSVPTKPDGSPKSVGDYAWTSEDPFIFIPLLPYYVNQVPKENEYVNLIYYDNRERLDANKFYIQGPITRPQNNFKEDWTRRVAEYNPTTVMKKFNEVFL